MNQTAETYSNNIRLYIEQIEKDFISLHSLTNHSILF